MPLLSSFTCIVRKAVTSGLCSKKQKGPRAEDPDCSLRPEKPHQASGKEQKRRLASQMKRCRPRSRTVGTEKGGGLFTKPFETSHILQFGGYCLGRKGNDFPFYPSLDSQSSDYQAGRNSKLVATASWSQQQAERLHYQSMRK